MDLDPPPSPGTCHTLYIAHGKDKILEFKRVIFSPLSLRSPSSSREPSPRNPKNSRKKIPRQEFGTPLSGCRKRSAAKGVRSLFFVFGTLSVTFRSLFLMLPKNSKKIVKVKKALIVEIRSTVPLQPLQPQPLSSWEMLPSQHPLPFPPLSTLMDTNRRAGPVDLTLTDERTPLKIMPPRKERNTEKKGEKQNNILFENHRWRNALVVLLIVNGVIQWSKFWGLFLDTCLIIPRLWRNNRKCGICGEILATAQNRSRSSHGNDESHDDPNGRAPKHRSRNLNFFVLLATAYPRDLKKDRKKENVGGQNECFSFLVSDRWPEKPCQDRNPRVNSICEW